jgi:putative ABC transport system permease protein
VALIIFLTLLSNGVNNGLQNGAKNIDLVAGANGSPLQLVLSTLYHMDIPSGNITLSHARTLMNHPQVKKAVPLALGDSHKGFRVVGTNQDYFTLFNLSLQSGSLFEKEHDVVAGAATGLKAGDTFHATHGFSAEENGMEHEDTYVVVGVLKPSGSPSDRLLLTRYEAVMHDHHHGAESEAHDEHDEHDGEITALLLQTKSPMAAMSIPRSLSKEGHMIAASPSYEIARLFQNLGLGRALVQALSLGFVGLSILMLFSNLATGLSMRQYDLAVLRALGASPAIVFSTVLCDGIILALLGALAGLAAGHGLAFAALQTIPSLQTLMMPADTLAPSMADIWMVLMSATCGALAALVPALRAAKSNVAQLLSRGVS